MSRVMSIDKKSIEFCIFSIVIVLNCSFSIKADQIPRPFNDELLPRFQRDGQYIDHLGHLLKMKTLFAPRSVEGMKTKFSIYNQRRSTEGITFTPSKFCLTTNVCHGPYQYDITKMAASGFNPNSTTVVMISGFLSEEHTDWMDRAKDSWLHLDPAADVILVSWTDSNRYIYSKAVAVTSLIARQITIFLYYLAELNGSALTDDNFVSKIHFIGHSLGAHIGGFVGQDLAGRMGRITGLDPAGPFFDISERRYRLDREDAKLVVALHTNGGKIRYMNFLASGVTQVLGNIVDKLPILDRVVNTVVKSGYTGEGDTAWFGIDQQVGHIDFYANDGRKQPGCGDFIHSCDHGRSGLIYEDILRHELELKGESLRLSGIAKDWRKQNRLIAFESKDYQEFSIGDNFKSKCPSMLEETKTSNGYSSTDEQIYRQCTLPIDLLTPVDELRRELEEDYDVDLNSKQQSSNKYFFKTLSDRPLVEDHFLLKIWFGRSTNWVSSCAFRAELKMSDGMSETIELNKELSHYKGGNLFSLAMPFINRFGSRARDVFILHRTDERYAIPSRDMQDLLINAIPIEVNLSILGSKSTSVSEAIGIKLLRLGIPTSASKQCQMNVRSVEILPIKRLDMNYIGLYGWLAGRIQGGGWVDRLTFEQYNALKSSAGSGQILNKSNPTVSFRLDGFVIG